MRFKLLAGRHYDPSFAAGRGRLYAAPCEIETDVDLCAKFNTTDSNFPRKFERIDGGAVQQDSALAAAYRQGQEDARAAFIHAQQAQSSPVAEAAKVGFDTLHTDAGHPSFSQKDDGLDAMTVKDLQRLASEEEVDLKGAKSKEDIVRVIRQAAGQVKA